MPSSRKSTSSASSDKSLLSQPKTETEKQDYPLSPYRNSDWTVVKLREELLEKNLSRIGNKEQLIERLEEYHRSNKQESLSDKNSGSEDNASLTSSSSTTKATKSTARKKSEPYSEQEKADSSEEKSKYSNWKLVDLQAELKRRNIPSSGKKSDLMRRLVEYDSPHGSSEAVIDLEDVRGSSPKKRQSQVAAKVDFKTRIDEELSNITFLNSPLLIAKYFSLEMFDGLTTIARFLSHHRISLLLIILTFSASVLGVLIQSPYQSMFREIENGLIWYCYWVVLGIASSIGLGTGLHTFLLFLGPFIAKVTIFAHECGNLGFETWGDHAFICDTSFTSKIAFVNVFTKVMLEALAWGAGTAIGELPPYFVARAAALAGKEDEEFDHIDEIKQKLPSTRTFMENLQLFMFNMMQRMGFFGILISASIPNPLFDLAGITCGHFLIPFSTFFGATFIGKALVKASLQTSFIIFVFSKESIERALVFLETYNQSAFEFAKTFLEEQKVKFSDGVVTEQNHPNLISVAWNGFIGLMILYFLASIVKALAVARRKRELTSKYEKSTEKSKAKRKSEKQF